MVIAVMLAPHGWVSSADFAAGYVLLTADGRSVIVQSVRLEQQRRRVYNLHIADTHTYFVGTPAAWTHNSYKAGDLTPRGRVFSDHAADRANERGFTGKIIDSIVDNNRGIREAMKDELGDIVLNPETGAVVFVLRFTDSRGNTVITHAIDKTKIVTVYGKGGGNYIPKSK